MTRAIWTATALLLGATAIGCASGPSATAISDRPDTPFKLATFEAAGQTRLGLVLGARVLDIAGANQHLTTTARLAPLAIPTEMKALIEQYATVSPRLYQIANYFGANAPTNQPFAFDEAAVTFKAPIKYPWNLMAASANYKAHAEGMGAAGAAQAPPPAARSASARPPAGGFDASAASRIVPDRDAPVMFAKSPRSCIIDPNEPFYIVDGRQRTDYEGELAIVMGPRPAYRVPREQALDYVFGYTIMQDLSDRGSERLREVTMFPGANWFDGKSIDRAAPFGPVIVPREFLPNGPSDLRLTTRLNGEVVQDARTSNLIWSEPHLVAYVTSRMTLYPGDVISTGTPAGTGMERQVFLKPGDVVSVEVEGIGTLTTPFKALSEKPAGR
ncbi:MAG TPA: fumarylacetoacetate hydrolase family protein [Vicinamibacterales bacterium]|nr:fumarylacetoacetate hydrolase family protein [Vicinamibacterales bacterium]